MRRKLVTGDKARNLTFDTLDERGNEGEKGLNAVKDQRRGDCETAIGHQRKSHSVSRWSTSRILTCQFLIATIITIDPTIAIVLVYENYRRRLAQNINNNPDTHCFAYSP